MARRNALAQCPMVAASVGTGDRSGAIKMEADGLLESARYGFCLRGYGNDTSEVVRLGENLSGREVERLADLFLAVEK
jgi:hypothetical protein